ncbi:hypothetical protein PCURB6_31700 [Paenibacillus curdlanolyticus]|nr:hypothetical protein PCURB6_31700 [Paenibacillus curdlanolyticus]
MHDLAEVWERKTNRYGVFEEDDTRTLAEQNRVFDIWWEKPGVLFPYLIRVDGLPAGLVFVATAPYLPCQDYTDYYLNEFFLMRQYRGQGVGEEAVRQVIGLLPPGQWEVHTNRTERNGRAIGFWRKTLANVTGGRYTEQIATRQTEDDMLVFRFIRE